MFGLMIRMRRDEPRCGNRGHEYSGALTARRISRRTHRRANTKTGRDGPDRVEDLMSKQRPEQSQDSIFVDNPFVDGFLEWMGSREGRQCIEARDVLWDLLEDLELDAKQRQLIWPDAERLDLVQSIQRIQKLYPDFPGHEIEEVLLNWIDFGYDPENYSQAQLNELDSLTERWVADHLRNANASKTRKRTRHS
jgi:hypothetical protein